MKKLTGLVATAFILSATVAAADYGAIYYSQDTGAYGYAWNYSTQDAAEDAAYRECRNHPDRPSDCSMATWFRNACGALSVDGGPGGAWAGTWGNTIAQAERKALDSCRNEYGGRNCRIEVSFCSDQ